MRYHWLCHAYSIGAQQWKNKTLFDLVETGLEQLVIKLSGSDKTVDVPGSVVEAQLELRNGWVLYSLPPGYLLHFDISDPRS